MKLLESNFRKGSAKVKVENLDDLWYLSTLIDVGDKVSGSTLRKIKIGSEEDRNRKVVKKPVFIGLTVEKVELGKLSDTLRVLGAIVEGPEDIARGEHHTFNIEENTVISIFKEKWFEFQITKLKEACADENLKILLCIFDREEAFFALMKKYGYETLSHLSGNVAKKDAPEVTGSNFYKEIIDTINSYDVRYNLSKVIIGTPSFWKEELLKNLKDPNLKKKLVLASISTVSSSAFNELLKREEVKTALHQDRVTKEISFVEELMTAISKERPCAYGKKEVESASNSGAIKLLLVSDKLIRDSREEGSFELISNIMNNVDSSKGDIHIISSQHDGGAKLDGIGGIGAILRFALN